MQFVNFNDYFCDVIPTPEQAAVEDAEQLEPLQDDHPRRAAAPLLILTRQSSPLPPAEVILLTKCDQYIIMPPPSTVCCLSCPAGLSIPAQDATVHSPPPKTTPKVLGYYWTAVMVIRDAEKQRNRCQKKETEKKLENYL